MTFEEFEGSVEIERLTTEIGKLKNLLHFYTMDDPTYKEYNKYLRSMGLDKEIE